MCSYGQKRNEIILFELRFNEGSSLFAVERNKGLESIIGNIYQSFGRTRYL